jgi:hypothetical protein
MIRGGVIRSIGDSTIITTDDIKNLSPIPSPMEGELCCELSRTGKLRAD